MMVFSNVLKTESMTKSEKLSIHGLRIEPSLLNRI